MNALIPLVLKYIYDLFEIVIDVAIYAEEVRLFT
jgi:hypothetical protein